MSNESGATWILNRQEKSISYGSDSNTFDDFVHLPGRPRWLCLLSKDKECKLWALLYLRWIKYNNFVNGSGDCLFITQKQKCTLRVSISTLGCWLATYFSGAVRTTILNNQTIYAYFMNRFFAACDALMLAHIIRPYSHFYINIYKVRAQSVWLMCV